MYLRLVIFTDISCLNTSICLVSPSSFPTPSPRKFQGTKNVLSSGLLRKRLIVTILKMRRWFSRLSMSLTMFYDFLLPSSSSRLCLKSCLFKKIGQRTQPTLFVRCYERTQRDQIKMLYYLATYLQAHTFAGRSLILSRWL